MPKLKPYSYTFTNHSFNFLVFPYWAILCFIWDRSKCIHGTASYNIIQSLSSFLPQPFSKSTIILAFFRRYRRTSKVERSSRERRKKKKGIIRNNMQPIFSSALFFLYQNYAPTLHHLVSSHQDFKLLSVIVIEATISKFLESLKLYHNYNCGYISYISSRFSAISKFLGSLKPKPRQQFKSLLLIPFQFVFKHCCNVFLLFFFLLFAFLSHYFVGMSS